MENISQCHISSSTLTELAEVEERSHTDIGLSEHNNPRFGTCSDSGSRNSASNDRLRREPRQNRRSVRLSAAASRLYRVGVIPSLSVKARANIVV